VPLYIVDTDQGSRLCILISILHFTWVLGKLSHPFIISYRWPMTISVRLIGRSPTTVSTDLPLDDTGKGKMPEGGAKIRQMYFGTEAQRILFNRRFASSPHLPSTTLCAEKILSKLDFNILIFVMQHWLSLSLTVLHSSGGTFYFDRRPHRTLRIRIYCVRLWTINSANGEQPVALH
jgi:hypothetical protein